MTYPISAAVSAGDATLASHYNNLRKDALYLGQAPADAVSLGAVLERYEARLSLERLNTTQVRVPASATKPVSLVVDGFLVQAVLNVDLAVGDAPSGAAAAYYVFANRADAATTFTLSISDSATELDNQRRIGQFWWDGSKIVKDSVRTDLSIHIANTLYLMDPILCGGRLTVTTGEPVSVLDYAAATYLYFTPYIHNRISLYVKDYGWRVYTFGEISVDFSAYPANTQYDVFIYDDAGTLKLQTVQWSSGSLRAVNLVRQDGVWVKSGAPEYRYLGSVRTNSAGAALADTDHFRYVFNAFNRVERILKVSDNTNSWTYTSAAWRPLRNDWTGNVVRMCIGLNECLVSFQAHVYASNSGGNPIGVGVSDNSNTNIAQLLMGNHNLGATYNMQWYGASLKFYPGVGYQQVYPIEYSGGGTTTFYGDAGGVTQLSGGMGSVLM